MVSARQQTRERAKPLRLGTPDWSGILSRTDTIAGHLICSHTGWRLDLTATADGAQRIHITGRFASPVMADDAAPWTDEFEVARPHEARVPGYDCFWTGFIDRQDGGAWSGTIADRYGGRLLVQGRADRDGVMTLRAATQEVRQ